ncbi:DUF4160 domain-containing protein [Mycetohabitans endofungorum]|uniref:DUF4160 domain-containing protein n=1 Tax=Mycetohabitans endofungorum TaxID=417203 RepID=UPI002B05EDD9|nr:DUF4160 domain-containing protein [Mycetohabitans endofungorum]
MREQDIQCRLFSGTKASGFFFYSDEGTPREPLRVHARGNGNDAKFWLYLMCELPTATASTVRSSWI